MNSHPSLPQPPQHAGAENKQDNKVLPVQEDSSLALLRSIKKVMDDYYLDVALSLFGIGDILSQVLVVPFLYFALAKARSIRLAVAILHNAMIDILVGILPVPVLNLIFDGYYRSFRKNLDLIVGWTGNDKDVVRQVNKKFASSLFFIALLCVLIYLLLRLTRYVLASVF